MKPARDIDRTHVFCEAYFPRRVLAFGRWCEGHNLPGRWYMRRDQAGIIEFARKVKEAGGLFYFDGKRYEYERRAEFEFILQRGYVNPAEVVDLLAQGEQAQRQYAARLAREAGEHRAQRSEHGAESAERAAGFMCLVTRKVSPKSIQKLGLGEA